MDDQANLDLLNERSLPVIRVQIMSLLRDRLHFRVFMFLEYESVPIRRV
jgi:hypothetical protein